tara:strand:+ start:1743 stop:1940 length:198 start_codon:yes stop_codon:yes gene_type:complete
MNIKYKVEKEHIYSNNEYYVIFTTLEKKEFDDVNQAIKCYKKWVEENSQDDVHIQITVIFNDGEA